MCVLWIAEIKYVCIYVYVLTAIQFVRPVSTVDVSIADPMCRDTEARVCTLELVFSACFTQPHTLVTFDIIPILLIFDVR